MSQPIYHSAMPNNSYILDQLNAGQLHVGYIKGHKSKCQASQVTTSGTTERTIEEEKIEWGIKSSKKCPIPMVWNDTRKLQEFFDECEDFTIMEMDVYFEPFDDGTFAILPYRSWSFKPSYSTKIFGQIPSDDLRTRIIKFRKSLNLPREIRNPP